MRAKRVHGSSRPVFSSQLDRSAAGKRQSFSCGFVFVVALIVIALGWSVWQARESAREKITAEHESAAVAMQFLTAAQQQDYVTAQGLLTPSGQYTMSADALQKSFGIMKKEWGNWLNIDLSDQELRSVAGLTMCDCDYTLVFDHGSATVRLVLVHGFKGWRVNTMSVD